MDTNNLDDRIESFLGNLPDKYSILQNQIPIETQLAYFDFSKKIKNDIDEEQILSKSDLLFDSEYSIPEKKILLALLASIPKPEIYRLIEKFYNEADDELKHWSNLALIESRMQLESSILGESQVLITTGLGGKNNLLRYFIVGFTKENNPFSDSNKLVINNEFDLYISEQKGEIEKIDFFENYFTITCLLPISLDVPIFLKKIISECNIYGNFLRDNYAVTNVKYFDSKDIASFLDELNNNNQNNEK